MEDNRYVHTEAAIAAEADEARARCRAKKKKKIKKLEIKAKHEAELAALDANSSPTPTLGPCLGYHQIHLWSAQSYLSQKQATLPDKLQLFIGLYLPGSDF